MRKLLIHIALVNAGALMLASAPAGTAQAFEAGTAVDAGALTRPTAPVREPVSPVQAVQSAVAVAEEAMLEPGEFVWNPHLAPEGEVEIVVSIPLQRAYVYRGGTLIGLTTVSTGKPGHATPTGRFPILQKNKRHFSNLYNNAPMPFMQRLTWDGIALHAGAIPGKPASHGCVRLPLAFAGHLFGATRVGATVHITDKSPAAAEALAMVRGGDVYAAIGRPVGDVRGTN